MRVVAAAAPGLGGGDAAIPAIKCECAGNRNHHTKANELGGIAGRLHVFSGQRPIEILSTCGCTDASAASGTTRHCSGGRLLSSRLADCAAAITGSTTFVIDLDSETRACKTEPRGVSTLRLQWLWRQVHHLTRDKRTCFRSRPWLCVYASCRSW